MRPVPSTTLVVAVLAFATLVFALVQTLRLWWQPFSRRQKLKRRQRRAALGESQAHGLLTKHGYEVLGAQVSVQYGVWLDGQEQAIELRADYLVRRDAKTFVAEVKTGREAPQIQSSATRRQLLEYRIAFDVDGVLLVDAESGRIRHVEFPIPEIKSSVGTSGWTWLLVGTFLGALGLWTVTNALN
jgi:Holliday junction resolvase-like predicted endonuclease